MAEMSAAREVCVIGGSRYFGKRVVDRLLRRGDRVTVINRGSTAPPHGATHLTADRNDEESLREALGSRWFDVVIDQVCYTPVQAEIARRVFGPRTRRYVLTSTVMVYENEDTSGLVTEEAVDPRTVTVDTARPWNAPGYVDDHYGEGKRQCEAVFARAGDLPYVSVRVAHVLGGNDDHTGRLQHYVTRIAEDIPVLLAPGDQPATYVSVEEIADFLVWVSDQEFTGPVNATSHGPLTARDLCSAIQRRAGGTAQYQEVEAAQASPLSFFRAFSMDNSRAEKLGYRFLQTSDWLDETLAGAVPGTSPEDGALLST